MIYLLIKSQNASKVYIIQSDRTTGTKRAEKSALTTVKKQKITTNVNTLNVEHSKTLKYIRNACTKHKDVLQQGCYVETS